MTRYYNNGVKNIRIDENAPVPEGFVPGMKKRSPEEIAETQRKTRETNIKKYGAGCVFQSDYMKEKARQTCMERYGADHHMHSKEISDKVKKTNLERYGVEFPMQSKEIQKKMRETNIKKYGVEYPLQSKEIWGESQYNANRTRIQKFGNISAFASPEVREKIKKTMLERHGVEYFCQSPDCVLGHKNDSTENRYLDELLSAYGVDHDREFSIGHKAYDFKIGSILIELDPYPFHNTLWSPVNGNTPVIDQNYHQDKSRLGESQGYQVIHIFDWDSKEKIIENILLPRERVYARKCELKEVSTEDCDLFLNEHHLQNTCRGQKVRLGLYYNDELISLMTFGKPRYNKNYQYELLRYCSIKNIIGGVQKMFIHFLKEYNPESIISYCDRSKFRGDVYKKLGFTLKSEGKPSCHWYGTKDHRHITDNFLRQRGYDQLFGTNYGKGTSNEQLMVEHNFVPIYDCGQDTYVWSSK